MNLTEIVNSSVEGEFLGYKYPWAYKSIRGRIKRKINNSSERNQLLHDCHEEATKLLRYVEFGLTAFVFECLTIPIIYAYARANITAIVYGWAVTYTAIKTYEWYEKHKGLREILSSARDY